MEVEHFLTKMVLKNGQIICLYSSEETLAEMISHPKFLKMKSDKKDVFISIEDIAAFEIVTADETQKPPETNAEEPPTTQE